VKNLRGIVYLDVEEQGIEEALNWLVDRFRYRNLGVTPSMVNKVPSFFEGRLSGKPFVKLVYPTKSVKELINLISNGLKFKEDAVEAVVLASAYVSPIIVLGNNAREKLESMSVDRVESKVKLDTRGWKLHLRIADYTVLDLYQWSTAHAESLWDEVQANFVRARTMRITRDKRRYWRLKEGTSKPWTFLLYVDLAQLIVPRLKNEIKRIDKSSSVGLAIEAAVIVREAKSEQRNAV
jgi:hypothetical protein